MIDVKSYPYSTNTTFMTSSFVSTGQNGDIHKISQFNLIEPGVYNFGFGDLDPSTGNLSDTATSNNGDLDNIMATLANIIADFFSIFPDANVFVQGSNLTRTRLYQMYINRYWAEINPHYDIKGFTGGQWQPFKRGVNYQAFIVKKRADI